MYIITGVYRYPKATVVHCLEKVADSNGNRKTVVVTAKPDYDVSVGNACDVYTVCINGKYYNRIKK